MRLAAFLLCFALLALTALGVLRPTCIDYTDDEVGAA